jgi:hypothetical protein
MVTGDAPEQLAWSPDGAHVAYLGTGCGFGRWVHLASYAGGFRTMLPCLRLAASRPSWSDSGWVIFQGSGRVARNVYLFASDHKLHLAGVGLVWPAWSPDDVSLVSTTATGGAVVTLRPGGLDRAPIHQGALHIMVHGTRLLVGCQYDPRQPCLIRLVLHTAGLGFDTRLLPNGDYDYCVQAVTIANHAGHTCWAITIANPAGSRPAAPLLRLPIPPGAERAKRIIRDLAAGKLPADR